MLSKRIAGILRQYPNPEVAFYATLVLIPGRYGAGHTYMGSCVRAEKRGRGRTPRFYTNYKGADGRIYATEVAGDAIIDLRDCINSWELPAGRQQLANDTQEMGGDLAAYMRERVSDGIWFDDTNLAQNFPTEVLATWVAAWVNRWLKGFATIQTAQDEYEHYASIRLLSDNITELADYVGHNRVDPGRLTLNQLLYRSRRWHAALAKAQKAADRREMAKLTPPSDRVFDDGAFSIFRLTTNEALEFEGRMMSHCVATYTERVRGGACEIYSVRDAANLAYATLEVRGRDIWQIKGVKNAAIKDPELCQVIANFIAAAGFVNHTDSCQLEPAPIEVEPGGEDEIPAGLGANVMRDYRPEASLAGERAATLLEEVVAELMAWGLSETSAREALQREIKVAKFVLFVQDGPPAAAANAVMYRAYPEIARERARFFRARRR